MLITKELLRNMSQRDLSQRSHLNNREGRRRGESCKHAVGHLMATPKQSTHCYPEQNIWYTSRSNFQNKVRFARKSTEYLYNK